jgi:hypothetical protein
MGAFIKDIAEKQGIQGFYAGSLPAIVGVAPYMGFSFTIYEFLKFNGIYNNNTSNIINNNNNKKRDFKMFLKQGVCGGISGGLSKIIVYPLGMYLLIYVSIHLCVYSSMYLLIYVSIDLTNSIL